MQNLFARLWRDDAGVIISAELVLILTIVVIGVIVGLVQVQHAVVAELNDVGLALSHLNQSYAFTGFRGAPKWWGRTSWTAGSSFIDIYEGPAIGVIEVGSYAGAFGYGHGFGAGRFGSGYGFGFGGGVIYGTIILRDGTLIPIRWIASGTWELPGGIILRATAANSNRLVLADGTTIGFVLGLPAIVELADGTLIAVSPGAAGAWVMADGRIITLDATRENIGILPDGTTVTIRMVNPAMVVLANGTMVEARAGVGSTLVLTDGRVIRLHDAILPPGSAEFLLDLPGDGAAALRGEATTGTLMFANGTLVPLKWTEAGKWSIPGGVVLTATSPDANRLQLADGTTIGFLFGSPAIVELADKTLVAARPGAAGTWVLADGRIVTLVRDKENLGRLADGTIVGLRVIDGNVALLASGTTVEVEKVTELVITLTNGLVLNLADAILPRLPAPVMPHFGPGAFIQQYPVIQEFTDLNIIDGVVPGIVQPHGAIITPPTVDCVRPDCVQPNCCEGSHSKWPRKRRLTEEIPQGPAPQYLPQL